MKPTPAAIEAAARRLGFIYERDAKELAEAVLSGPLGDMVLVPREATDEMLKAALRVTRNEPYGPADDCIGGAVYRAMIAAAQED